MSKLPAFLLAGICLGAIVRAAEAPERYGAATHADFKAKVHHPYQAGRQRIDSVIAGAKKLRLCAGYLEVRKLLGAPDFGADTRLANTRKIERIGAAWTYLLREGDPKAGTFDQQITVWLDASGRVSALHVKGVDGVDPIHAKPTQGCS